MALSVFISVNHETEEDKTEAVSDTSLPSSDLVDLLLSEAKELLAPILSNKDGKHWMNWGKMNPSKSQGSLSVLLTVSSTFYIFPWFSHAHWNVTALPISMWIIFESAMQTHRGWSQRVLPRARGKAFIQGKKNPNGQEDGFTGSLKCWLKGTAGDQIFCSK